MNNSIKTHRLFFALWPSDQVRQSIVEQLSGLSPRLNGRVMQQQNLHITLHFVGQVTESTKDCMHAAAQSVEAEGFQLNLDRLGLFPKAKIFWMGAQNTPEQLMQLHVKLGTALEDCSFVTDKRAFAPHLTLLRNCRGPVPENMNFSIPWRIEEFVLVESITYQEGVKYQVLERYSLL